MNIDLQIYKKSKPSICNAHDRHNDMNKEIVYDQIDNNSSMSPLHTHRYKR